MKPCEISQKREIQLSPLIKLHNKNNKTKEDFIEIDRLKTIYNVIDQELNRQSHYGSYSSFIGSPISKGLFQFDLWGKHSNQFNSKWDWNELRKKVIRYGVRNSLLVALMPTASTSQILGNNECFEPFTNNVYTRKTLAGLFRVVNKYLIEDLQELELWNDNMKSLLILNKGSIQNIKNIPKHVKDLYKTAYEIKQKSIIQQAADRGPLSIKAKSMNLFVDNKKNISKILDSALTYGWKKGLKTGLYYLRSKKPQYAIQFSIDKSKIDLQQNDDEECLMCGS